MVELCRSKEDTAVRIEKEDKLRQKSIAFLVQV